MKHKLESRLPGEISVTSDMYMIPPLWQKARRTKEPLDEIEPFNSSFFGISGWGIGMDYCDTEWFVLEMNRPPRGCLNPAIIDV